MPDSRNPSKDPRAPRRSTDEVPLNQPQPVQIARSRVSSNTNIVNFAPPPSARRPSWIAPTPDLLAARRPSWTPPLPLDAAGNPMYSASGHSGVGGSGTGSMGRKTRMFYPATAEESESGSASGSGNSASNPNSANNSGSGSDDSPPQGGGEGRHGGGGVGGGPAGDSSEEASSSSNNFRVGMQIDMKRLVGDAVGNMSISPTSRDIVLAARRGLFIIDLESPLSVPRFLPQKLLIWNLLLPSSSYPPNSSNKKGAKSVPVKASASAPSSIAHILHAHYRAITDINWHPAREERDVVASTGVDSWIWAWDLRAAAGGRAVFGLSAFNAGGTQVKWNRQDPHLLASSHAGEVLVWDRRKGSLPSARLRAHRSKIYGIDWSPARRDELVTCALDGEIKVWDLGAAGEGGGLYGNTSSSLGCVDCAPEYHAHNHPHSDHSHWSSSRRGPAYPAQGPGAQEHTPLHTIRTAHPVWRARHLPFGRGVLSLPQRGGTGLGMYAFGRCCFHFFCIESRADLQSFGVYTGPSSARTRAGSGASGASGQRWTRKRRREDDSDDDDDDSDSDRADEHARTRNVRRARFDDRGTADRYGDGEAARWDSGWGGDEPVEVFEGHTDVVKEFVWRRSEDGTAFQLITWSKDRTLRFWPVEEETMAKVGHVRPVEPIVGSESTPTGPDAATMLANVLSGTIATDARSSTKEEKVKKTPPPTFSFRNPPPPEALDASVLNSSALGLNSPHLPALSAPVGARAILAGVRASIPLTAKHGGTSESRRTSDARAPPGLLFSAAEGAGTSTHSASTTRMSRGTAGGRRVGMDALTWLSNVKEVAGGGGGERSSSGGRGGGAGSSGGVSEVERGDSAVGISRRRSDSRGRVMEDMLKEGQSLQDELTSVINKLVSAKIKLEKHDLTKKRTCTLGLHGPWGESSSVFIRITFTFPKDYPHRQHPRGIPTVELERNPLISLKNRAFILRRLRALRERQRPCLEACLRFLSEGEKSGAPLLDSESSDEGELSRKSRDFTVSLLRSHKNLAEPRTSQGTFGPNGELVCFFRAPPRIVRHVLRDSSISASPAKTVSDIPTTTHDSIDLSAGQAVPRVFRSPALIADAVRRLSLAAADRIVKPLDPRRPQDGDHILRIMTNLLTFSHDTSQHHRDSESSRPRGEEGSRSNSFAYPAPRRSTVFITNTTHISGGDRKVATGYVFEDETLALVCQKNAEVAREHGRYDHERVFKILQALFPEYGNCEDAPAMSSLVVKMVSRIHSELCKMKDLQMLAMLSMIVLQGCRDPRAPAKTKSPDLRGTPTTAKSGAVDYFSMSRSSSGGNTGHMSPVSPTWPRLTASPPVTSSQAPLSTSNSSRGSWSSLFNTGNMRQFMTSMGDTLKDGLTTPSEPPTTSTITVPRTDRIIRGPDSPLPRRKGYWRESGLPSPSTVSKSWNEGSSPAMKHAVSFSSAGHRRSVFSRTNTQKDAIHESRVVVFDLPNREKTVTFSAEKMIEFLNHVHIYADVLFSWRLFHKRLELLKSVNHTDTVAGGAEHGIGLLRACVCGEVVELGKNACRNCSRPCGMPHCTVCRLPVKGLSRSCLRCFHVTHISCWRRLDVPRCPSGCGCLCDGRGFAHGARFEDVPAASTSAVSASGPSSKG
ncbi:hypothetical protein C8F04DRAFT_1115839 [Mycena alexandri]|uniref:WDR59/RTC1-like RING zinc finger domain-containing protein n=1 Tax=Mycena alexandri TaxID=1745969 RepID=A0AAD6SQ53_9AGAR|nr:hypothetical protein C8F04DRAFT_1115839 [Mycena alexandri]